MCFSLPSRRCFVCWRENGGICSGYFWSLQSRFHVSFTWARILWSASFSSLCVTSPPRHVLLCMCLYLHSLFSMFLLSQTSSSAETFRKPFVWVFQPASWITWKVIHLECLTHSCAGRVDVTLCFCLCFLSLLWESDVTTVVTEASDCNSGLQLSVPGSFLIQLEPSEPFMFSCDSHSSSSFTVFKTNPTKKTPKPHVLQKKASLRCLSTRRHLWIWMCSFLRDYILLYSSPSVFSSPWETRYLKIFIFMYFSRTRCTLSY